MHLLLTNSEQVGPTCSAGPSGHLVAGLQPTALVLNCAVRLLSSAFTKIFRLVFSRRNTFQTQSRRLLATQALAWWIMRQSTQIVPQHIHNPEHYVRHCLCLHTQAERTFESWSFLQEVAEMAAFTPYGTSEAAAVVACILYFMFFCCAVANYIYTNYPFYDVLIISTACKSPFRHLTWPHCSHVFSFAIMAARAHH